MKPKWSGISNRFSNLNSSISFLFLLFLVLNVIFTLAEENVTTTTTAENTTSNEAANNTTPTLLLSATPEPELDSDHVQLVVSTIAPPPTPNVTDDSMNSTTSTTVAPVIIDQLEQKTMIGRSARLSQMLRELLNPMKYDKTLRPDFFGGPVQVGMDVLVLNIPLVDEVNREFSIDFYLRQTWRDPRLAFNMTGRLASAANGVEFVGLTPDVLGKLWLPDTFFRNGKKTELHSATVPNQFVRLYPNGTVKISTRLTVTATCIMELDYYPMDRQICGLILGSYGYTNKSMQYSWFGGGKSVRLDLTTTKLPQFTIRAHQRSYGTSRTSTGEYSFLSFQFILDRSLGSHVAQVFAPCTLIVVVAYFALWMGRDNSTLLPRARIGLGITSVLTITTIFVSNSSKLANNNELKALDVFLSFCFIAVFSTLFQSCVVIYFSSALQKRNGSIGKKKNQNKNNKKERGGENGDRADVEAAETTCAGRNALFWVSKFDISCRFIFPVVFGVCHLIYWTHYLNASHFEINENEWVKLPDPK